jgi:DNA-binding MarR family transcriptional regulator
MGIAEERKARKEADRAELEQRPRVVAQLIREEELSGRDIAERLGVEQPTVQRAVEEAIERGFLTGSEKVRGRDGKQYPIQQKRKMRVRGRKGRQVE